MDRDKALEVRNLHIFEAKLSYQKTWLPLTTESLIVSLTTAFPKVLCRITGSSQCYLIKITRKDKEERAGTNSCINERNGKRGQECIKFLNH